MKNIKYSDIAVNINQCAMRWKPIIIDNIIDLEGQTITIPYEGFLVMHSGGFTNTSTTPATLNLNNRFIIGRLDLFIDEYNQNTINIINPREGTEKYDYSLKKVVVYNGSSWVDERGFTANINKGNFSQAVELVTSDKITSNDAGYEFFAIDLRKPIYYGGDSKWYDAMGTEVTVDNN